MRMLANSNPKWWNPPWEGPRARRIARAYEADQLRRRSREVDPPCAEREYWNSLLNDECAPSADVWRACVENDVAEASLPIGYDGTWQCPPGSRGC